MEELIVLFTLLRSRRCPYIKDMVDMEVFLSRIHYSVCQCCFKSLKILLFLRAYHDRYSPNKSGPNETRQRGHYIAMCALRCIPISSKKSAMIDFVLREGILVARSSYSGSYVVASILRRSALTSNINILVSHERLHEILIG